MMMQERGVGCDGGTESMLWCVPRYGIAGGRGKVWSRGDCG